MAAKSVNFGIIGCGMIARFHAQAIAQIKNAKLLTAVARSKKSATAFGAEYGIETHTDISKMLATPGLDAVAIATPSGMHLEHVALAAKAKKHVICEKPLEVTVTRCDKLIKICKKNRVVLAGIFPWRTDPAINEVKKAIEAGRFGKMTAASAHIRWWRSQEYYDSGAWRGTWKLDGGGCLMNQGIHTIDLFQWLCGPVTHVSAFADRLAHTGIEVEDTAVAVLRFKNGALGTLLGTTAAAPGLPIEIRISGDGGSAFWRDSRIVEWQPKKTRAADRKILAKYGGEQKASGAADPGAIDVEPHRKQFADFIKVVNGGGDPMVGGLEARKAVEIIQAVYKSAQSGRVVKLPLKSAPRLGNTAKAAAKLWKKK